MAGRPGPVDSDLPMPSTRPLQLTGPAETRFDLVLLAAGFTAESLPRFRDQATAIHRELLATQPFGLLRRLVNVWRVDRIGDDLAARIDAASERVLTVDAQRAWAALEHATLDPDALLVVVDSDRYAGSGVPGLAVVSCHPDAPRLALHELGHAAFDLADEYGGPGPAASGAGEPTRVNVTRVSDPARVKWADLVGDDGTVGCFEGGDRTDTGIYRPTRTCLMRTVGQPFCPICHRQITATLLAFHAGRPGLARRGAAESQRQVLGDTPG